MGWSDLSGFGHDGKEKLQGIFSLLGAVDPAQQADGVQRIGRIDIRDMDLLKNPVGAVQEQGDAGFFVHHAFPRKTDPADDRIVHFGAAVKGRGHLLLGLFMAGLDGADGFLDLVRVGRHQDVEQVQQHKPHHPAADRFPAPPHLPYRQVEGLVQVGMDLGSVLARFVPHRLPHKAFGQPLAPLRVGVHLTGNPFGLGGEKAQVRARALFAGCPGLPCSRVIPQRVLPALEFRRDAPVFHQLQKAVPPGFAVIAEGAAVFQHPVHQRLPQIGGGLGRNFPGEAAAQNFQLLFQVCRGQPRAGILPAAVCLCHFAPQLQLGQEAGAPVDVVLPLRSQAKPGDKLAGIAVIPADPVQIPQQFGGRLVVQPQDQGGIQRMVPALGVAAQRGHGQQVFPLCAAHPAGRDCMGPVARDDMGGLQIPQQQTACQFCFEGIVFRQVPLERFGIRGDRLRPIGLLQQAAAVFGPAVFPDPAVEGLGESVLVDGAELVPAAAVQQALQLCQESGVIGQFSPPFILCLLLDQPVTLAFQAGQGRFIELLHPAVGLGEKIGPVFLSQVLQLGILQKTQDQKSRRTGGPVFQQVVVDDLFPVFSLSKHAV